MAAPRTAQKVAVASIPPAAKPPATAGVAAHLLAPWTAAIALAVVTAAVYLPSLRHGFLNWDDDTYITENPHVRRGLSAETVAWAFRSREAANWHPLTWLSHALDVTLFGLDPRGHHATSIALHALAAALLLIALHRLTRRLWPSTLVAALFALHPLHVESVSWIAERKDVLCGLFTGLTLWAYAFYAERPSPRRYLLVAASLAAALLSKPMAVTVPFVLLLLDYWPLGRLSWRSVAEKLPLVAMVAASSVVTLLVQQAGGAVRGLDAVPLAQRLANAAYAYVMYLVKTFWPAPGSLTPFYPLPEHGGPAVGVGAAAALAATLAAISLATAALRRQRPYLAVGWLIYVGMLVPVIGIVQVGAQRMADRYAYLPLVGVFMAVTWLAADWLAARPASLRRAVVAPAAMAILVLLSHLTVQQQAIWSDSVTFWQYNAAAWPGNGVAWNSLANALWQRAMDPNQPDRTDAHAAAALEAQRRAVAAEPQNARFVSNLGDKLYAVAKRRQDAAQMAEAEQAYRRALELDADWYGAEIGLGNVAQHREDYAEAIRRYERAAAMKNDLVAAHYNLGMTYHRMGNLDAAITSYRRALALEPNLPDVCRNLAAALTVKGQTAEAAQWARRAAELESRRQ
jgi:tetratricopeptide (TPR) repeat protein